MRRVASIALVALLSVAGAASAQPQDDESRDLACMVVVMMFASQASDPTARQGAMAGFGYYMGRLKGRAPEIDLKARLIAEARSLTTDPARLKTEAARCGADMQAWGRETQEIGEALKAEGAKMQGTPAT